jgi:hypothetical protein
VSRWTPCKRGDFIRKLRKLGFDGPYSGTRHQFMIHSEKRLAIPSNAEYSVPQLRMMIREAGAIWGAELRWRFGSLSRLWGHRRESVKGQFACGHEGKKGTKRLPLEGFRW